MLRLTLATRITLLVCVALAAVWIAAFSLYLRSHADQFLELRPAPTRVAAIVELFETMSDRNAGLLTAALASDRFELAVAPGRSTLNDGAGAPAVAEVVAQYQAAIGDRPIAVTNILLEGFASRLSRFSSNHAPGYEFRIGLRTGDTLILKAPNPFIFTRFGFPIGFGAGLFGTVVAFIAILVMQRETRPLSQLAAAVDNVDFSSDPIPLPKALNGAPEIRAVILAFNRLQERLTVVLKARMALIGGISHDVRTFATRLRLRIDGIEDDTERQKAETDIADMIRLLDDALLSSRAGAGELSEELVEFWQLVVAEVEDRKAQGARIELVDDANSRDAIVLGDRLALRRIVANITDNALKYGHAAHLLMAIQDGFIVLMVDDEGPGIAEDQRDIMMEPFSRLEQSRNRRTGGAGLGLAIVRALLIAHQGSVQIGNGPLAGARVTIRLPLFVQKPANDGLGRKAKGRGV